MRLDEWQKYIDSQFLEEEPDKADKAGVRIPNAAPGVKESRDEAAAAPVETPSPEGADLPPGTASVAARPETTPNAIQNIVTMVVAPPETPFAADTPRAPRIELLTPLPDRRNAVEPTPEVSNRTRRRSQLGGLAPEREATEEIGRRSVSAAGTASSHAAAQGLFPPIENFDADIPSFEQYLSGSRALSQPTPPALPVPAIDAPVPPPDSADLLTDSEVSDEDEPTIAVPEMSDSDTEARERIREAPKSRGRYARNVRPETVPADLSAADLWAAVPRHVQTLLSLERLEAEKEVAQFSYKRPFQEKRHELIARLLDPILSLEDTARLLNVCPTTVRRYTNKGILTYYRKEPERSAKTGGEAGAGIIGDKETRQRRFRLSDILTFLETQQAAIAADRQAELQEPARPDRSIADREIADRKDA